jgi:hypothetical protein
VDLGEALSYFEATRITKETTFNDIAKKFPEHARIVEKDVTNHKFLKHISDNIVC